MGDKVYPYSVLYVEDEVAIRQNYVEYLKMFFQEVYEAGDGLQGYKMYEEKKPDIMIVDIDMPVMNGLELMQKIRKNDQNTKAIMLTAHTDTQYLLNAAELKLSKYLKKPIDRKELKSALHQAIEELKKFQVVSVEKIDLSDGYSWDFELKQLQQDGNEVKLTKKEGQFLQLLFSAREKIFTYEEISIYVWGYDETGSINAMKTLVKKLRQKIPRNMVENVFGVGYKVNCKF